MSRVNGEDAENTITFKNANFQTKAGGKFLFLSLSFLSLILLVIATMFFIWWFIAPRVDEVLPHSHNWIITAMGIFYVLLFIGILLLLLECYSKYSVRALHKLIRFSIICLFPVNMRIGKLLRISKDRIRESFVHVNNTFVKRNKHKFDPNDVLVVIPHCLQNSDCQIKVTNDISFCKRCGNCTIGNFKEMAKTYNVKIAIATGGTIARMIILKTRPKFILAVACHQDLVNGLLDAFPILIYGVLNEAPFGPCMNTTVDIGKIDNILNQFVKLV